MREKKKLKDGIKGEIKHFKNAGKKYVKWFCSWQGRNMKGKKCASDYWWWKVKKNEGKNVIENENIYIPKKKKKKKIICSEHKTK